MAQNQRRRENGRLVYYCLHQFYWSRRFLFVIGALWLLVLNLQIVVYESAFTVWMEHQQLTVLTLPYSKRITGVILSVCKCVSISLYMYI